MKNRILITILIPLFAVGIILLILASIFMLAPLVSHIHSRIDSDLVMIANLGYEKCVQNSKYKQYGQEAENSLQNDTLAQIETLGRSFDRIQIIVVNQKGEALGGPVNSQAIPFDNFKSLKTDGTVLNFKIFNQPSRCVARYFPAWRWTVIGHISQKDYSAQGALARKIFFAMIAVFLLGVILTTGLTFYFQVNRPLRRIIHAAQRMIEGRLQKVADVGKGEIGQVAAAFNAMVDSLAADKRQIERIMIALRQSEELYRVITENSGSQIILVQKGRVVFANRRTLTTLGYSADEMVGEPAHTHLHSDDQAKVLRMARLSFLGRHTGGPVECRYYTKQADMRWMELAMVRAAFKGKSVLLVHGIDITQRKQAHENQQRLETKLRQAQKMEAIGTLAGGIAHDFNNLLMGIQGNVSLLRLDLPDRPYPHEKLNNIETYVKNGSELTRQLLGYARGGKYKVRSIDINDLVKQSAHMFGRTKKEIVLHFDLEPEGWAVEADRGQIEQVLLNLYVNAWQAMPGGGHLYLKTRNRSLGPNELKTSPDKVGDFIQISVADTGVGIDERTLQRIYDPFFTTKQRERGTGLGLASAYGIIKNHNGAISCESQVGKGTTFHLYLPRTEKEPAEEPTFDAGVKVGSERILMVDDEAMILEAGHELMKHLGYQVTCASSGKQALDIFGKDPGAFDLVLLDLVLPEMSGPQIFEGLRKIRLDVPILLCSGYGLRGPAADLVTRGCNGFIQKPFDLDSLSHHLRRILDEQQVQTKSAAGGIA